MLKKVKFGKVSAVVFLTVLVWVWADLASDEEDTIYSADIAIAASKPELWASFDSGSSASVKEIGLKGPSSRIAEVRTRVKQAGCLKFDLDVVKENMGTPGLHTLQLLSFLQKDAQMKQLGVKVLSCKPDNVSVTVRALVKTKVEVKCRDEKDNPVNASIDPPSVEILLPEDWPERVAYVQLSVADIEQARLSASPILKTPEVRLAGDRTVKADQTVEVRIPSEGVLPEETVPRPSLGFVLSAKLQGKYKVDVSDPYGFYVPFKIRATPEAKRAYENETYQLILEIRDGDVDFTEYQPRQLKYVFPDEFVSKGEIKPFQPAPVARFKLIPLPPREEEPVAGPSE
jgi:hypothetical protein